MVKGAGQGPFDWALEPNLRSIAIVGISKNAGKTTLLNHLLSLRQSGTWGVFSTGIDGEERDSVFKTPKPAVKLGPNTIFCCDTKTLDDHGSGVDIMEKLPESSAKRQLWLAKSLVELQTEITGPSSVKDQIRVLQTMNSLGAGKVLIDGSLDRKSIALSKAVDAVTAVIGASFGSLDSIINEIRRLRILNELPEPANPEPKTALLLASESIHLFQDGAWQRTQISSMFGNEKELKKLLEGKVESIYIPGAVTDSVYKTLRTTFIESKVRILLRHPECLKLGLTNLERFVEESNPEVLIPFKIKAWAINSHAVGSRAIDAADFRAKLRQAFTDMDLPDLRELQA
ncbi:MAG: hypothetical protein WCY21_00030 [Candidatus Cloacimonadaceae bacterium]|jgi:hypothetical protein